MNLNSSTTGTPPVPGWEIQWYEQRATQCDHANPAGTLFHSSELIDYIDVVNAAKNLGLCETDGLNNADATQKQPPLDINVDLGTTNAKLSEPNCTLYNAHRMLNNSVEAKIKPTMQICNNILRICAKMLDRYIAPTNNGDVGQVVTTREEALVIFNYVKSIRNMIIKNQLGLDPQTDETLVDLCLKLLPYTTPESELDETSLCDFLESILANMVQDEINLYQHQILCFCHSCHHAQTTRFAKYLN